MFTKRGAINSPLFWITIIVALVIAVYSYIAGNPANLIDEIRQSSQTVISFKQLWGDAFAPLDFIIGRVPQYLIDQVGSPTSASIIILGIWLILLFTFADILSIFGLFSKATSWVIAAVLSIIAANLKLLSFISVFSLVFTAAFGALSVFMSIILVFAVFLGINLGIDSLRVFAVKRSISEAKIRALKGSEAAREGLDALKKIGHEVGKNED